VVFRPHGKYLAKVSHPAGKILVGYQTLRQKCYSVCLKKIKGFYHICLGFGGIMKKQHFQPILFSLTVFNQTRIIFVIQDSFSSD
jgi:hypothetical protein